jgi:CBS domain-containing protein
MGSVDNTVQSNVPVARLVAGNAVTVSADEPIERVYALMGERGERFVAVRQGRRITAVLDRESLRTRLAAPRRQLRVRDVVRPGMACLPPDAPVYAAATLMRVTGSAAVPVLDESHALIGLVTAEDVADALS